MSEQPTARAWARVGVDSNSSGTFIAVAGRRRRQRIDLRGVFCERTDDGLGSPALSEWISKLTLRGQAVAFCVDDRAVQTFPLSLPKMPPRDSLLAVRHAVGRDLSAPSEMHRIDYLERRGEPGEEGKQALTGVAVETQCIDEMVKRINLIGLRPQVADLRVMALRRLADHCCTWPRDKVLVVVEVERDVARLIFLRESHLLFHREVPIGHAGGGGMMDLMGLENDTAPQPEGSEAKDVADQLATEIRRSLHYGNFSLEICDVEKILLCGAGLPDGDVTAPLSETFGAPSELLNPLDFAEIPADGVSMGTEHGPALAVAVGLALREDMGR